MDTNGISYAGKKVSVGIDVLRDFFVVSAVIEGALVKRCRIAPRGEAVLSFIGRHFRGALPRTCYEIGYSGFWLHRFLVGNAVANIVVHAAKQLVQGSFISHIISRYYRSKSILASS